MTDADKERVKLLANALNTAATSCFTVGIATPLAGYIYGDYVACKPSGLAVG